MNKTKLTLFALLLGGIIFSGCEQPGISSYQGEHTAVDFISDSTSYSFLGNSNDEYVQEIQVKILGDSAGYDRFFNVEVVDDSLTTAVSSDYEIGKGVVKAGQFFGTLPVRLFNSEKLSEEIVSLHLRISESEDFKPGSIENSSFRLSWTDKVIVPAWTWYRFFFCANPSTTAYRVFVESTGRTSWTLDDYRSIGQNAAIALGRQFGDYIKQYNLDHPDTPLIHEDGPAKGQPIEPIYYTQSKFD